ncbi:hypothetical protein RRG08_007620 [Elysia crispata]|uniref:Reverse transcriptase domain-containing protein n=1 Tax=Elysia crispata TaxID=231223 RepID=A0AAE1EE48_9GAST|nr:hypothetical protein RRG08_007620 [Elysia crispata]
MIVSNSVGGVGLVKTDDAVGIFNHQIYRGTCRGRPVSNSPRTKRNRMTYPNICAHSSLVHATSKVTEALTCELLFADDAALTSHTKDELQQFVTRLSHACKEFGLTISLNKTNVTAQGIETPSNIAIDGYTPEVVENFTYFGSTISSSLSINSETNSRVAKAATVMAKLNQRDLKNTSINPDTWESLADNRPAWRHAARQGTLQQEAHRVERSAQKQAKRKQRTVQPQQPSVMCRMRQGLPLSNRPEQPVQAVHLDLSWSYTIVSRRRKDADDDGLRQKLSFRRKPF